MDDEKPQPKDPTLVGVGQTVSAAVVVGAVGRREREPVEVSETQRWIFEPKAKGEGVHVARLDDSASDALDDGWGEEPVSATVPSAPDPPDVHDAVGSPGELDAAGASEPVATAEVSEAVLTPPVAAITPAQQSHVQPTPQAPDVPPSKVEAADTAEPAPEFDAAQTFDTAQTVEKVPAADAAQTFDTAQTVENVPAGEPLPTVESPFAVATPKRGPSPWMRLLAALFVAGAAGAWWRSSTRHPIVAVTTSAIPATSGSSTSETTGTPSASAAANSAPSASAAAPPAEATSARASAESVPASEPRAAFDARAAKHVLDATAKTVANCRHGKIYGAAKATVTFGNDGTVSACVLPAAFAKTPTGTCVIDSLSSVHVPPFRGKPAAFVHRFVVAPKPGE